MRIWTLFSAVLVIGTSVLPVSMHVHAYPTSINCIPTAQTLEPREMLLEMGRIGYRSLSDADSIDGTYFQLGVGRSVEIGADAYRSDASSEVLYNGKFRFFERGVTQAAAGFMDVGRDTKPTFYLVTSTQLGKIRPHLGLIRAAYSSGLMAGLDFDFGSAGWVGLDYLPGANNHLRVGIGHSIGSSTFVQVSYGRANDRVAADDEIAVTLSFSFNLWRKE